MNPMFSLRRAKQLYGANIASYREEGPMTWAEFYDRVHRAAAFLRDLGIQKGDRVAVWMLNSHEYLEIYYATLIAGVIIVPLNTRWHESDVAFSISDSGSVALVVDNQFAARAAGIRGPLYIIFAGRGPCPAGMTAYAYSETKHRFEEPDPDDLVGLFYTSGTTGGPKGVMLTHRNIWANLLHGLSIIGSRGPWLHAAPMFHIADMSAIHGVTVNGRAHAFLPAYDPERFMQMVERHKASGTVLVPTMITMLLNHPSFGNYDLASLENVLYGASPMPLRLIRDAIAKLPHAHFRQGYGLTETSPLMTVLEYEDHFGPAVSSAGKPIVGVEVRIVDDLDRDVPVGECGEIITRGCQWAVMKGY